MLKILIIDDEKNIRIGIKTMLNLINTNYEVIGEAASVEKAKLLLQNTQPDIVLLDIELKDGTGFDLLNQLDTIDFKVIFITAFNQYAIKAFKFNALDYLLKPVDPMELKEALIKAKGNIKSENVLKEALQNIENNKKVEIPKIVIKTTERTYFIPVDTILYCQSEGSYTKIVTHSKRILASKNLKNFEDILSEYMFIRTHQSYLVNKAFISSYRNDTIFLRNEIKIPVSSRKKTLIKSLLLDDDV